MVAKDISPNLLKLVRIGIDARNEYMVFMRKDCPVCISEGFEALNRIIVAKGNKTIVASLIVWDEETHLKHDQLGLSEAAIDALEAKEGELLRLSHLDAMSSMSYVWTPVESGRV